MANIKICHVLLVAKHVTARLILLKLAAALAKVAATFTMESALTAPKVHTAIVV